MVKTDKDFYDRKVVYLDYLERGEKVKNGGFVKWETRGKTSRIQIHIRGLYPTDTLRGEIQLISRKSVSTADSVKINFGAGEYVAVWDNENLAGTAVSYAECDGVQVRLSESRLLLGQWREREALPQNATEVSQIIEKDGLEKASENVVPVYEPYVEAAEAGTGKKEDAGWKADTGQAVFTEREASTKQEMDAGSNASIEQAANTGQTASIGLEADTNRTASKEQEGDADWAARIEQEADTDWKARIEAEAKADRTASREQKADADQAASIAQKVDTNRKAGKEPEADTGWTASIAQKADTDWTVSKEQEGDADRKAGKEPEADTGWKASKEAEADWTASIAQKVKADTDGKTGIGWEMSAGWGAGVRQEVSARREAGTGQNAGTKREADTERETALGQKAEIRQESDKKKKAETERQEDGGLTAETKETAEIRQTPKCGVLLSGDKWEQLNKQYPHIHPFGDAREYLSITPRDFIILSRKYQNLVQNSFLLHGYYNYGHVILTKIKERDGESFYLGVPGVYFTREKQAALMFGFEGFEAGTEQAVDGGFGYYMKQVDI